MDILFYLIFFGAGMTAIGATQSYNDSMDRNTALILGAEPVTVPEEEPDQPSGGDVAAAEPSLPSFGATPAPAGTPDPATGFVAEDQTPTGKMTTAAETKPILSAIRPQWVAVREYDGKDLVYFTALLAWRCAVLEIKYSINDGPMEVFDAEPCYVDEETPNALKLDNFYIEQPLQSVQGLHVEVLYDDLSTEAADYDRASVLID